MGEIKYNKNTAYYFSLFLLISLGIFTIWMIAPFLKSIFGGLILTAIFFPVYTFLERKLKKRIPAAVTSIILMIVLVLIPISTIATAIAMEISQFLSDLPWLIDLGIIEKELMEFTGREFALQETFIDISTAIGKLIVSASPEIAGQSAMVVLKLIIAILIMYFVFTENESIIKKIKEYLPFSKKNSDYLASHTTEIINAILVGQGLSAILQCIVMWITFAILDIKGATFWAFVVLVVAFMPIIGASIVWIPASIIMLLQGHYQESIVIVLVGIFIISGIENILKPFLVKGKTKVHALTLILGIFAGLNSLGVIGLFIGPIILAVFLTVVDIFYQEWV